MSKILKTTVVGSYPKLGYVEKGLKNRNMGKITENELQKIFEKATKEVVEEQIRAGIDVIADGEQYRSDMVVYFAKQIEGFDEGEWVRIWGNNYFRKPIVLSKVKFNKPMTLKYFMLAKEVSI